jgi:hypothetical protein
LQALRAAVRVLAPGSPCDCRWPAVRVLALAALIGVRYWQRRRFLRELEIPRIGVDE